MDPVHRENLEKAIELSEKYASCYMLETVIERSHMNILIAYVSAYGYTKKAAEQIACRNTVKLGDINVEIVDIEEIFLWRTLESKLFWLMQ